MKVPTGENYVYAASEIRYSSIVTPLKDKHQFILVTDYIIVSSATSNSYIIEILYGIYGYIFGKMNVVILRRICLNIL